MREVFASLVDILHETSPYLVVGFALAGALHVLLQRFPRITAALTGPGKRPIVFAALLGMPIPLCSCSVVPAAMALRRRGASKATMASFLVSVPETDIVSVLVTLALIGPFVAVYRPLAGIACALMTGFVIRAMEKRERTRHATSAGAAGLAPDHCCGESEIGGETGAARASFTWWLRGLHYGFIELFDDIMPQLILGIVVAALIGVALPQIDPQLVRSHTFLSYLIMVVLGIPAYVCAAASTPIAAGLIAGGVSPGAAMVFLLAGPATNLASVVVLRGEFGNRVMAAYVAIIAVSSVALGALLDILMGSTRVNAVAHAHHHGGNSLAATVLMCMFLLWTLISFHRSRLLPRMRDGLSRRMTARPSMK